MRRELEGRGGSREAGVHRQKMLLIGRPHRKIREEKKKTCSSRGGKGNVPTEGRREVMVVVFQRPMCNLMGEGGFR